MATAWSIDFNRPPRQSLREWFWQHVTSAPAPADLHAGQKAASQEASDLHRSK